jgi:hypothetical protein
MMKKIIILTIVYILTATNTYAANLYFETFATDDSSSYVVNVMIDTEGELVNAIEGEVLIPISVLNIDKISDGDSSINFWLEKPRFNNGKIYFSGITPGGFQGPDRLVFSMRVIELSKKVDVVEFGNVNLLKNDSVGTRIISRSTKLSLPISTASTIELYDTTPPEDFEPSIISDLDIFNGKYMLVFATQDKESGVDHYEVKEGYFGDFNVVTSPYELMNQDADSVIIVKAIDNSGNERTVKFYPPNHRSLYERYEIIVILVLVIILYTYRKKWLKSLK